MSEQITLPSCIDSLGVEDKFFVISVLREMVSSACYKFVAGQKEHGGRITDRPCLKEAQLEVIDQMFYLAAAKLKHENEIVNLEIKLKQAEEQLKLRGIITK